MSKQTAEDLHKDAVDSLTRLNEEFEPTVLYQIWLGRTQEAYARHLYYAKQYGRAIAVLNESISTLEEILANEPKLRHLNHAVSANYRVLSECYDKLGRKNEARNARREADHRKRPPEGSRGGRRPFGFGERPPID